MTNIAPSAERERECLDTSLEELDLERAIDDRSGLPDQLIQARFDNGTVPSLVDVAAMSRARRLAVDRHTETARSALA